MPMYLDDIAEKTREFKVLTYSDHKPDEVIRYFDSYDDALAYYNRALARKSGAEFTASVALIRVATGEPLIRQTWRV
jgi:hypothetical protein